MTGAYPDEMFEEAERREKSNRVLRRYNDFYNEECSGMPHGTPITPEHQQIIAFEAMIDAIRCEYYYRKCDEIAIRDIQDLIERLHEQSNEFLKRVEENNERRSTKEGT
jgi:cupin superfamily acireductone dioxygenase involved in methionine salvage